ncbi:MAG: hypothetical protein ACRDWS_06495 [Acidimicrobiia bacterium]
MSHVRPEETSLFHRKFSCRRGRHRFGVGQQVGGGIIRRVCVACGSVTIDLTGVTDTEDDRMMLRERLGG